MAMRPTVHVSGMKAAVAACALLCAAVALAILATASPVGGGKSDPGADGSGAALLDNGPLGR